jgi:hypothetical protein
MYNALNKPVFDSYLKRIMGVWEKPKLQTTLKQIAAIGANSLNAGKLIATDAGWV